MPRKKKTQVRKQTPDGAQLAADLLAKLLMALDSVSYGFAELEDHWASVPECDQRKIKGYLASVLPTKTVCVELTTMERATLLALLESPDIDMELATKLEEVLK